MSENLNYNKMCEKLKKKLQLIETFVNNTNLSENSSNYLLSKCCELDKIHLEYLSYQEKIEESWTEENENEILENFKIFLSLYHSIKAKFQENIENNLRVSSNSSFVIQQNNNPKQKSDYEIQSNDSFDSSSVVDLKSCRIDGYQSKMYSSPNKAPSASSLITINSKSTQEICMNDPNEIQESVKGTTKLHEKTPKWRTSSEGKIQTSLNPVKFTTSRNSDPDQFPLNSSRSTQSNLDSKIKCYVCREFHFTFQCPILCQAPQIERIQILKKLRLCFNCLLPSHNQKTCRNKNRCRECNQNHHSLIHRSFATERVQPGDRIENSQSIRSDSNPSVVSFCSNSSSNKSSKFSNSPSTIQNESISSKVNTTLSHISNSSNLILLPTAEAMIENDCGESSFCRLLLDSASASNFITKKLVQQLNLKPTPIDIVVSGLNQNPISIQETVEVKIHTKTNEFHQAIVCLVVPSISDPIPSSKFDISHLNVARNRLADPNFNVPSKLDIVIGVEHFFTFMQSEKMRIGEDLILQNTLFGWTVVGKFANPTNEVPRRVITCLTTQPQLKSSQKLNSNPRKGYQRIQESTLSIPNHESNVLFPNPVPIESMKRTFEPTENNIHPKTSLKIPSFANPMETMETCTVETKFVPRLKSNPNPNQATQSFPDDLSAENDACKSQGFCAVSKSNSDSCRASESLNTFAARLEMFEKNQLILRKCPKDICNPNQRSLILSKMNPNTEMNSNCAIRKKFNEISPLIEMFETKLIPRKCPREIQMNGPTKVSLNLPNDFKTNAESKPSHSLCDVRDACVRMYPDHNQPIPMCATSTSPEDLKSDLI